MKLWMSAEVMHDVYDDCSAVQNYLEKAINALIENYSLGIYEKWAVIAIILDEHGPNYPEVFRNHKSKKVIEFRLKIDHDLFLHASAQEQITLVAKMLLRSLDEMVARNKNLKIPQSDIDSLKIIVGQFISQQND
jgi:hypothetical protein